MINENLKNQLEEICKTNLAKELGAQAGEIYISVPLPKTEIEAENLARFWNNVYNEKKDDIHSINFVYQEKEKELPLPYMQKLIKKVGFDIKSKTEEGEIGNCSVSPELIRSVEKSYLNFILKEEEWKPINNIAQNCDTFYAPLVFLPKNLCYAVKIPLECIIQIKFKEKK